MTIRKLFIAIAMLGVAATPSYATTITYNFAARIDLAIVFINDLTLDSVQTGDVLHGTITLDASLPDLDASPDVGSYVAMSVPSVLSLTVGPFGMFPQETFPTSSFLVRIAENGHGLFANEELLILSNGSFLANGDQVDQFEVRLDSDSLSFLSGTGFPAAVDLGLLNSHSLFEFIGHDPTRPSDSGFEFLGSFTEFEVASDAVPEPGSIVLIGSGLLALAGSQRRRLWRRLRGRPVSESGRLCHGDEGHEWSARRPVGVDVAYSPVHNYSLLSDQNGRYLSHAESRASVTARAEDFDRECR